MRFDKAGMIFSSLLKEIQFFKKHFLEQNRYQNDITTPYYHGSEAVCRSSWAR